MHYDNLVTLAESRRELGPVPSYWTVRRFLKAHGLVRRRRRGTRNTVGAERAAARLEEREVRSCEAEYVVVAFSLDILDESNHQFLTHCFDLPVVAIMPSTGRSFHYLSTNWGRARRRQQFSASERGIDAVQVIS